MKYYKYLSLDRTSPLQDWQWPPVGKWTEPVMNIEVCKSGYHICRPAPHFDLLEWSGETLYEVEWRGNSIASNHKLVVTQARLLKGVETWTPRTRRLFACDCLEHQLVFWEKEFPGDTRIADIIDVARRFANGKASQQELNVARNTANAAWKTANAMRNTAYVVWCAEWYAADAVRNTAYDVWKTADAVRNIAYAACNTADAACNTADAVRSSVNTERKWQLSRLMQYINSGE